MEKQNAFTLLCAGENTNSFAVMPGPKSPGTLWFSPAIGQMILTMEVTPLSEGASVNSGEVKLHLQIIGGGQLDLEGDQADKFMRLLGMRKEYLVRPSNGLSAVPGN